MIEPKTKRTTIKTIDNFRFKIPFFTGFLGQFGKISLDGKFIRV
jgi:hypothetical protein